METRLCMHSKNQKVNFTHNGATNHFCGPPNKALQATPQSGVTELYVMCLETRHGTNNFILQSDLSRLRATGEADGSSGLAWASRIINARIAVGRGSSWGNPRCRQTKQSSLYRHLRNSQSMFTSTVVFPLRTTSLYSTHSKNSWKKKAGV